LRRLAALALLALPAAAQQPGWEARAVEWAPALRACLGDHPGGMVIEAWEAERAVAARLLLPGGAREDCRADPAGTVLSREPVGATDRRPGEGIRAFMPERRCVDAWRVEDASGRELGWLAYPGCG
jgi:hypothetical protein